MFDNKEILFIMFQKNNSIFQYFRMIYSFIVILIRSPFKSDGERNSKSHPFIPVHIKDLIYDSLNLGNLGKLGNLGILGFLGGFSVFIG